MKRFLKPLLKLDLINQIPTFLSNKTFRGIGFLLLIIGTLFFFAKGIVDNDIRILVCVFLVLVLGVFCLRIASGVIAILIYLPFMAFIRRFIYSFNPYAGYDPILIISSVLTLFMFGYIFIFHGEEILRHARENKLLRYFTYFLILLVLEVFNPAQGGLEVGFAGIIYWIIPFFWFYFGFFISKEKMRAIFYMIVGIGIITALYGLHQLYYGFLPFEKYWIKYGGFAALHIKQFMKVFSTFTNPQEYTQYLLIAGAITFMYLFKKPFLYLVWIGSFIVLMYGMFMASSRMGIFFFFVLIGIFVSLKIGSWRKALFSNLIFLGIIFFGISKVPLPSKGIPISTAKEAHLAHLARGIKAPFSKESTAWHRIRWVKWVWHDLKADPFGRGIGATTRAVQKFGGRGVAGAESWHFAIAGSCGFPGIILYLLIMYWIIKTGIFLVRNDQGTYWVPVSLAIWFTIAADPRLYSIGPFVYLLWGWITKEAISIQKEDMCEKEE